MMPGRNWTPEPWKADGTDIWSQRNSYQHREAQYSRRWLAAMACRCDECHANARRIVAAVNAVEGIPTEALEAGVVRQMLDALQCLEANDNGICPWCNRDIGKRDEFGRIANHAPGCQIAEVLTAAQGGSKREWRGTTDATGWSRY